MRLLPALMFSVTIVAVKGAPAVGEHEKYEGEDIYDSWKDMDRAWQDTHKELYYGHDDWKYHHKVAFDEE